MSDIRRLWFFVATWQQQAFLWVCNVYICNSNVETKVLFSTCTASNEGLDVWWWMRNKVMSQHSLYRWSRHPILSRLPFLSTRTWGSISTIEARWSRETLRKDKQWNFHATGHSYQHEKFGGYYCTVFGLTSCEINGWNCYLFPVVSLLRPQTLPCLSY